MDPKNNQSEQIKDNGLEVAEKFLVNAPSSMELEDKFRGSELSLEQRVVSHAFSTIEGFLERLGLPETTIELMRNRLNHDANNIKNTEA